MDLRNSARAVGAAALLSGAVLAATPAFATIEQRIFVGYDPTPSPGPFGDEITDGDSVDNSSGPIASDIFASIAASGYSASGSVGRFGNLGVTSFLGTSGELRNQVVISNDEIVNLTGSARNVTANFIIDGGEFHLIAGAGSTLEYVLTLSRDGLPVWQTFGDLVSTTDFGPIAFTQGGTDIGASQTNPFTVELPIAFESADLGVLEPNDSMLLEYQLDIIATGIGGIEGIFWEYSDPLDVTGFGDFPTVDIQMTAMPEPGTLAVFGFGLAGLAVRRRWARG